MKHRYSTFSLLGIPAILIFWSALASAQPTMSQREHETDHPGAQVQAAPGAGMGMMGGPGMMGGRQMMGMPMMPYGPCGMMGPMTGSGKDLKTAARMMEMHADMMRANAAIMEKYAKDMESEK